MLRPISKGLACGLAALAFLLTLLGIALPMSKVAATAAYLVEDNLIKLSGSAYDITLSTDHGAILSVLDKTTGKNISDGNADNSFWVAKLDNNTSLAANSYTGNFTYNWDEASSTLTLDYKGTLDVRVEIFADATSFKIRAELNNQTGANISGFDFPNKLKIAKASINDALLPMMPGAPLSSKFFTDGRTYINLYPGVIFADYLAVQSTRGKITLYTQRGAAVQPALIGFEQCKDELDDSSLVHTYRTWIKDGEMWTSPQVLVNIGQDYPATIASYRTENRIDQFPTLREKLGEDAAAFYAAPMYKLDVQVLKLTFKQLEQEVIEKMNFPGMVHPVAFQRGGHDHNYPDFVPPDLKWGSTDDFAHLITTIHDRGGLAVPYTNFSWWNMSSPTLSSLPKNPPITQYVDIKDSHGLPSFESYGPNSGFVMNMLNPFVKAKVSEQHDALLNTIGMDGVFEDQWGARAAPYDFNPAGLNQFDPATSYFEGVLDHYREQSESKVFTEEGVDVLAENGVGFMGTNYLWDILNYRTSTGDVNTYYPMAGMMVRDKVLLYQHDLAAETWTNSKEMLRWNLAQGYQLSNAFLDGQTHGLNMNNPWLNVTGVFQKYALSNYADELVTQFAEIDGGITQTTFPSYSVYTNWNADRSYVIGNNTLAPDGVMTVANDGSVTAGVFTSYNQQSLSDGDHYLVEVRSTNGIKVFQPLGADTPLQIDAQDITSTVTVTAHRYDGTNIGTTEHLDVDGNITFTYRSNLDGQQVGYYAIISADLP